MELKNNLSINSSHYSNLVCQIEEIWEQARQKAATAVNASLLEANWETGKYIVEYELKGLPRAEYGKELLTNLSRDLTRLMGKGFSRGAMTYMRKLYLAFPIFATLSQKLSWSHYLELLKCDNELERNFYLNEAIQQIWKVRELRRQMKSSLFERLALSTDKEGNKKGGLK